MQLLSKAHYLVKVPGDAIKRAGKKLGHCDEVWVGFSEHGAMIGHMPYQQDEAIRDALEKLARAKMGRFPNG